MEVGRTKEMLIKFKEKEDCAFLKDFRQRRMKRWKAQKCPEHPYEFKPDDISRTYGAGGTKEGEKADVCRMIQDADNGILV